MACPHANPPGPPVTEPFDLSGAEHYADPHATYARMRAAGPVVAVRFPAVAAWVVAGYDAAVEALTDRRIRKDHDHGNAHWRSRASIMPEPFHSTLQAHLLHRDEPRHAILRGLVTGALGHRTTARLRPRIRAHAEALTAALPERFDLLDTVARPYPWLVLVDALALPDSFADTFDPAWCGAVKPVGPADPGRAAYLDLLDGLSDYLDRMLAWYREHLPPYSPITRIVRAAERGRITADEARSVVFQLLVAGQEPVTNQLAMATIALLRHPAEVRRLRDNPALWQTAIDELLRFDSAFSMATWRFLPDGGELAREEIPAGDSIIVGLASANRDPARFADADRLALDRSPNPHLAFGHGAHYCPASSLAKAELEIMLRTLLAVPGIALDGDAEATTYVHAPLARGPVALPMRRAACGDASTDSDGTARADGVLRLLLERARGTVSVDPTDWPLQRASITAAIAAGTRIELALPAFPCKSPNLDKVCGTLPDEGERLALAALAELAQSIGDLHDPGARVTLCSDGHVFGDAIGVSDRTISEYGERLDTLIAEHAGVVRRIDLADVLHADPATARAELERDWAEPLETLRDLIRADAAVRGTFLGMSRFLEADHPADGSASRRSRRRLGKDRAYVVLQRSRAWGRLVAARLPDATRLSIHPQPTGSAKLGIALLPGADQWATPWHTVVLYERGAPRLVTHAEARSLGRPVYRDGRLSHYVASEATMSGR